MVSYKMEERQIGCKRNFFLMSGWPFRAQDCSSTSCYEGQLSAVLSVKDSTGLSVWKLLFRSRLCPETLCGPRFRNPVRGKRETGCLAERRGNKAQCLLKQHSQPRVLWAETGTTGPTVMCFPHSLQAPCGYAGLCEQKWQL